jgi:hypothetical protein
MFNRFILRVFPRGKAKETHLAIHDREARKNSASSVTLGAIFYAARRRNGRSMSMSIGGRITIGDVKGSRRYYRDMTPVHVYQVSLSRHGYKLCRVQSVASCQDG